MGQKFRTRFVHHRRKLLVTGIIFVVVGAALMDVAGQTQDILWWDVSGVCAFIGTLLALSFLLTGGGSDPGMVGGRPPVSASADASHSGPARS